MDFCTIFLLEAPRAPDVVFLQGSAGKFRETHSDGVRQSDVLNIKPF
jgi:hypothetical protein